MTQERQQLLQFMADHKITDERLGSMTAYTVTAVRSWKSGFRGVPPIVVKLVGIWESFPQLMKVF